MKNGKIHKNKYLQPIDDQLDLHGLTKTEARQEVIVFIEKSKINKYDRIRIITGKGLHSENNRSILNSYIKNILDEYNLKYSDAKLYDGGCGAIDIKLR